jgi:hypothetical protein
MSAGGPPHEVGSVGGYVPSDGCGAVSPQRAQMAAVLARNGVSAPAQESDSATSGAIWCRLGKDLSCKVAQLQRRTPAHLANK